MFEARRERKAQKGHEDRMAAWQQERDAYAQLLDLARTFNGEASPDILLAPDERLFFRVTGASLVEARRGPGHYEGHSSGVSIPIGSIGGRSVRYRVGANRGHYVQGQATPTAIDTGTIYVTNKRVVFAGNNQTRECDFSKMIGFQHDDATGSTTFSASNREKPVTVHYGPKLSGAFDFRLDLALAHYRGTVSQLVEQLTQELDAVDAQRPPPPA